MAEQLVIEMPKNKTITFKTNEDIAEQLDDEAEERNLSRSKYLHRIVENRNSRSEAIADLTEAIQEVQEEKSQLEAELEEQREEHDRQLKQRQRTINELQQEIRNLEQQRKSVEEYHHIQERIERKLNEEVATIRENIISIGNRSQGMEAAMTELEANVNKSLQGMEYELEKTRKNVETTKSEIANTRRYAKDAERMIDTHINKSWLPIRIITYPFRALLG
ncbi:MAG: hypothetical protein ACOCUO_00440 [archaeon]